MSEIQWVRAVRIGDRCEMIETRPRGRPLGEVSEAIIDALKERPRTVRQLAIALQCSVPVVDETCRRLRQAGRIEVLRLDRVEGSNRRAYVFQIAAENSLSAAISPSVLFGVSHGR